MVIDWAVNKMINDTIQRQYDNNEYCNGNYIMGVYSGNDVTVYVTQGLHLGRLATIDRCSNSKGHGATCLKYRQNASRVRTIQEHAIDTFKLCTLDTLERVAHQVGKRTNRGLAFEKLVTEYYGQTWHHDHLEWWLGPDIVIDGQPYQIKYDKAQLCHEGQAGLR